MAPLTSVHSKMGVNVLMIGPGELSDPGDSSVSGGGGIVGRTTESITFLFQSLMMVAGLVEPYRSPLLSSKFKPESA